MLSWRTGGPAGLVALKTLTENGFDPILYEAEEKIGGTFRYRGYENAELVSSKQLTAFSDFRFPPEQGDHVSLPEYVAYLERYVDHFNLQRRIRTGHRVVDVRRLDEGGHEVKIKRKMSEDTQTIRVKYLCICTGLHVLPQIPTIRGIQHISAHSDKQVLHSSSYKGRAQLAGKKVCILGTGETGMDLAYESIKSGAKEVWMCTRGGFLSFPKVLNNFSILGVTFDGHLPIDGLITNLFESTYVHKWVAASHLRWFVSDFVIKRVLWLLTGTSGGCNQWVGELPEERLGRAYVFLNKSHKAMMYLNRPYKSRSRLLSFLSSYHDPPDDVATPGKVEILPWPIGVDDRGGFRFDWGTARAKGGSWKEVEKRLGEAKVEPDLVLMATGYTQEFDGWLGHEYPRPWEANSRDIIREGSEDVSFIGFVRPGVGAIPPIAEQQAMWWTLLIQKRMKLPMTPPHYYLLSKPTSRIQYGVDHSTYMSTLAKDMGSAPGLLDLWWQHGWFITLVYCFSAAFTTNYRLVGPFADVSAPEIVRTELWETVTRRGALGNLFMGVIPMLFYCSINLTAWFLEIIWILLGHPDVIGFARQWGLIKPETFSDSPSYSSMRSDRSKGNVQTNRMRTRSDNKTGPISGCESRELKSPPGGNMELELKPEM
ncbi:dimethylaniline monooxygenase [Phaffia rhodozyma]|uniref:Dimethylaniline monooxygenase n=1 Tax=Phaffia rhodozyma TaxID=264483 RepID=A0A0F7SVF0_PHARH|nr:dimethylaniline monooxygenase [Phaffia rhodozyma]